MRDGDRLRFYMHFRKNATSWLLETNLPLLLTVLPPSLIRQKSKIFATFPPGEGFGNCSINRKLTLPHYCKVHFGSGCRPTVDKSALSVRGTCQDLFFGTDFCIVKLICSEKMEKLSNPLGIAYVNQNAYQDFNFSVEKPCGKVCG